MTKSERNPNVETRKRSYRLGRLSRGQCVPIRGRVGGARSAAVSGRCAPPIRASSFEINSSFAIRHSSFLPGGFTLIELLVTVTLMTFIVLGLLAMLGTTHPAFLGSLNQTDVKEAGRLATEMITRELEQMTPSDGGPAKNFMVELEPNFNTAMFEGMPGTQGASAGVQGLRTNVVQRFFFLSQNNLAWSGIGYRVWADDAIAASSPFGGMVGTLYRYSSNTLRSGVSFLSTNFINAPAVGESKIADGVVHLRVRPFATNGFPIVPSGVYGIPSLATFQVPPSGYPMMPNAYWAPPPPGNTPNFSYEGNCYFITNAVPAYLELELGILEPTVVDRYRSLSGNTAAQAAYLSNHVAQVHIFRQRIAVPNVDFNAYR